jgi:hypothetical protein
VAEQAAEEKLLQQQQQKDTRGQVGLDRRRGGPPI